MNRQIRYICLVCLLVLAAACTVSAEKDESGMQIITERPVIRYDGTCLIAEITCKPAKEGIRLLGVSSLFEMIEGEEGTGDALLAEGEKPVGVEVSASLCDAEGAPMEAIHCAFFDRQEAEAYTQGFIFLVSKDVSGKEMNLKFNVNVMDPDTLDVVESLTSNVPVHKEIDAETVSFAAEVALDEVLTSYPDFMMDITPPDWSRIEEVYVSSSEEQFCVLLYIDGDAEYEVACADAVSGEEYVYAFSLYNLNAETPVPHWVAYAFEPVQTMPEQLMLTINNPSRQDETAAVLVDIAAQTAALQK